ncbi:glycosyltransferase [Flavobacterium sp. CSZ]|uniref:glycosyltransferase n=1 Tax=Flavobacterium sp. CSZ TaxID=2783791 RepID=UPI00188CCEB8|nr:glycosyltransferase [Flavobacterium sp. CSZ]MBF4486015.1 glycosyltransferase [Flavobacterium sp. CSZ]
MYHKISPDTPTMWWVSVNDFYRQMVEISNKEVVYLDDYNPENLNQVVITFDGIYKNVLEYALPILKYFNYSFELFLTSDYIGLDNDFDNVEPNSNFTTLDELLQLVSGGGRLQWHTQRHSNLKEITDIELIKKELTIPQSIKDLDSKGYNWFAYPHGEFNDVVKNEVKKRFKGAVSCNQGNDYDSYALNRLTVVNETSLRNNKIACIVASYNYGDYLIEALESVLRQTILPNEILISDDCSDDETQVIAEGYLKKYPTLIKYNRNKTNLGIVDHFNKAISLITSEYIFFLGADNRLFSNYIEECSKILDEKDNIAIAYTDYAFFGTRAKLTYETFPEERKGRIIENELYQICFPEFDSRDELLKTLQEGNFIHGSSMFKRSVFNELGGYMKSNIAEDYNLFKRIIEKGYNAKKVTKTNFEYRQHSISQVNNVLAIQNKMLFYKNQYLNKTDFENSNSYRISLKLYKGLNFFKKNYKKPKVIIKKGMKYFLKKIKQVL